MKRSAAIALGMGILCLASGANAAEWIGRQPGNHDNGVEYEFHFTFGYDKSYGVGGGVRFGIPILKRGFIPSINNSVVISFGADVLNWPAEGYGVSGLIIPVMLQWNFYLTRVWSVFVEAGFAPRIWFDEPGGHHSRFFPWPGASIGTRIHFTAGGYPALVIRMGFPTGLTLGLSF